MRVNPEYHALRIEELELTADYLMKVPKERETAPGRAGATTRRTQG